MTRVQFLGETGKQYFIYSHSLEELANFESLLTKKNNIFYTFELDNTMMFGFSATMHIEMVLKLTDNIKLIQISGKDIFSKKITLNDQTVQLQALFAPEIKKEKSSKEIVNTIPINVSFEGSVSDTELLSILIPTKDLIHMALNIKSFYRNVIIHSPITIDNIEYSFMKTYSFFVTYPESTIFLSRKADYYIDSRYKCLQKIVFNSRDTVIVLPKTNTIVSFTERYKYLRDIIDINQQPMSIFHGINKSLMTESLALIEQEEKVESPTRETKEFFKEKTTNTPTKKEKTIAKEKLQNITQNTTEIVKEEKPNDEILIEFSKGGITNRTKIYSLIQYSAIFKNRKLFFWAVNRYSFFHPKDAIAKNSEFLELYSRYFKENLVFRNISEISSTSYSGDFYAFIRSFRSSLLNKDVLKFTKEKESFFRIFSTKSINESDYPREIVACLFSNQDNEESSAILDSEITDTCEMVKNNTKKLSAINFLADYYAEYVRYKNGLKTTKALISLESTIFAKDAFTGNEETAMAQAIAIIFDNAKSSGFGFSYTHFFDLTSNIEGITRKALQNNSNIQKLFEYIRVYSSNQASSWFKTATESTPEAFLNDPPFIEKLNSITVLNSNEFIADSIKKIESAQFVFKKTSYIEVISSKLISLSDKDTASLFIEFCKTPNKDNKYNLARTSSLFLLSEYFDHDPESSMKNNESFMSAFFASMRNDSKNAKVKFKNFMYKFTRFSKAENRDQHYEAFIGSFLSYFSREEITQFDKFIIAECLGECISGFILNESTDDAINQIHKVMNILSYSEKAIFLNNISRNTFLSKSIFKKKFQEIILDTIATFKIDGDKINSIATYFSLLETIFNPNVKSSENEESRRDLFLAREEDAVRKRINQIESFANTDEFANAEYDETTIREVI